MDCNRMLMKHYYSARDKSLLQWPVARSVAKSGSTGGGGGCCMAVSVGPDKKEAGQQKEKEKRGGGPRRGERLADVKRSRWRMRLHTHTRTRLVNTQPTHTHTQIWALRHEQTSATPCLSFSFLSIYIYKLGVCIDFWTLSLYIMYRLYWGPRALFYRALFSLRVVKVKKERHACNRGSGYWNWIRVVSCV